MPTYRRHTDTWTAPEARADARSATAQPAVVIHLPVTYTAFCLQHHHAYLRYAVHRLGEGQAARSCVEGALGELVTMWPKVMGSVRPSAVAWQVLRTWVAAAGDEGEAVSPQPPSLSALQEDTVVLRHDVGLSEAVIASVMGLDEGTVTSHLRYAARVRCRARVTPSDR
ncbi:hypothetical protein [Streptomyces sp. NBC_00648]|uniref:hypothetical protein n=1 Tax=Streptomyces sp. NBC_00648 TaxID=2975797 RepID=UPI003248DFE9